MEPVILFEAFGHPVGLFPAFVCFLWLVYLWEAYLDYRQYMTIKNTHNPPPELSEWIGNADFQRSKAYAQDKSIFSFIHDGYDVIETTFMLYFSVIPWLWSRVTYDGIVINSFIKSNLGIDLGINSDGEIMCSLVFLLYVTIYKFFQSLPWSLYFNFVIEARHGFNNQTFYFFIKDKVKATLVSIAIGFPLSSTLIWIIKSGGRHFYIYAYVFALIVTLIMMFVYPEFIAPLFDRYAPLPDGSLRSKIEALAASINFPLKKLLVVEGSKRSAHSNAYFYGFGKNKRIVLYDTLMRGFKFPEAETPSPHTRTDDQGKTPTRGCALDEEVVAVLGHELGHWKYGHTIVHLVIGQANLLLMFIVFSSLMGVDSIFFSFGFTSHAPVLLRLMIVFQFIFSPYNTILAFLMTVLSRYLEFQADRFAVKLGYGRYLKSALTTLQKDNLSFPVSDWLYSMCTYSHPPLIERLSAIDSLLYKKE